MNSDRDDRPMSRKAGRTPSGRHQPEIGQRVEEGSNQQSETDDALDQTNRSPGGDRYADNPANDHRHNTREQQQRIDLHPQQSEEDQRLNNRGQNVAGEHRQRD